MTNDELAEMLERAAGNGAEITFEDFYNIMTKKTFWYNLLHIYVYIYIYIDKCKYIY